MTYTQLLRESWAVNAPLQDRIAFFQYFWQIGDPTPISEWLGIKYVPPSTPEGLDLSDEWRLHVEHARNWVADVYHRLYEPVPV